MYDSDNLFPQSVTNAKNHQTQFTYDKRFGMQTQTIDPNGAKTETQLDDFGRVVAEKVSDPLDLNSLQTVKTYEYDLVNKPISVTQKVYPQDTIEVIQKTYMDGLDRVIQVRSEAENNFVITNTTYDELGNVKKSFLPFESSGLDFETINTNVVGTSFVYDALGRQTQITTPIGTTNLTYLLNQKQVIDSENNQKDYVSDIRGNLTEVKEYLDAQAYSTVYTYNSLNQLTKMTDAKGNVKNFTYDLLGQKLSEETWHTPNDTTFGTSYFSYDANGNLVQKINARNQTTNYAYDELNRLLVENNVEINGLEVENVYDQGTYGIGRLSSTTTPNVIKLFTYDAFGRVLQDKKIIDGQPFDLNFTYDRLGLPLSLEYPDTTQIAYDYNDAGQLDSIQSGTGFVITNLDYAPSGSLKQIDFANGVQTINTFLPSQMYRLTHKVSTFEGSALQDLAYSYDSVGNLLQIVDASATNTAKTTNYSYDDLYRLTQTQVINSANNENYTRTYSYDIIGNILSKSDKGSYVYSGGNDATSSATNATPHAVTSDGTKTYTYDDDGNLISDGLWTHVWDYNNRLLSSQDGSVSMHYTYDEGVNRLTKTNVSTGKKTYYLDKYYDLEGMKGKVHIYAGDLKVATKVSE